MTDVMKYVSLTTQGDINVLPPILPLPLIAQIETCPEHNLFL